MRGRARIISSEKGAVFVQAGISIFVLMAFNVFVLDYGMMWVARRQAQNAADAGALAGALARGYDDFASPPASNGLAAEVAGDVARANLVSKQPGVAEVLFSCPAGVSGRCTRVNLYRDSAHGNPINTLFGPILGIATQNVRATATAVVENGNATNCLRPVALADDWGTDQRAPANQFNRYDEAGGTGALLPGNRDGYVAPSATVNGNTRVSLDLGERIIWELDRPPATSPITRGLVVGVALPGPGTFRDKLEHCSGQSVQLGQTLPVQTPPAGDTLDAFTALIAQDPGINWNEAQARIDDSCAPGCSPISPRLIAIALYDPQRYQLGRSLTPPNWTRADVGCPSNSPCVTVTNIVGFFVHGAFGGYGPHGHFLKYPGMTSSTAPQYLNDASWMVTTHLIR